MNDITDLHTIAMELAAKAEFARRIGDDAAAERLFREAFEKEREAAIGVPMTLEPTRSVLLRSAASLALDCKDYREAERLIGLGLSGNAPGEICDEFRDLYETVTFHRHLELRGTSLGSTEFQLSLAGDAVAFGMVPATEYLSRVQTIERMLVRTAERKRGIQFREHGRPAKAIAEDFPLFMSAARAASFAATIRIGRPLRQRQLFYSEVDVVFDFLDCLRLFNDEQREELNSRIADDAYYLNFIHQARKLSPDGTRIRTVGLTALRGDDLTTVSLHGQPAQKWFVKPSSESKIVRIIGTLTQAEKDDKRNVIGVKGDTRTTIVQVPHGLMNDIVRPYWDYRVVVTAREEAGKATLLEIEPVEPTT